MVAEKKDAHCEYVHSVAFSPDGKSVVSCANDRAIRVWRVQPQQLTLQHEILQAHLDWVRSAQFSQDGTKLASGGDDQAIKVWDAASWALLAVVPDAGIGHVLRVSFDQGDSKLVASGSTAHTRVWDLSHLLLDGRLGTGGQVEAGLVGERAASRSVTADNGRVADMDGSALRLWGQAGGVQGQGGPNGGAGGAFYASAELACLDVAWPRFAVGSVSGDIYYADASV